MKLMAALSRDLTIIASEYSFIYEEFSDLKKYEDLPADRLMLDAYSLLSVSHNSFCKEKQFDTVFYKHISSDYPIKTLLLYIEKIGEIVNEMDENDVLILKVG